MISKKYLNEECISDHYLIFCSTIVIWSTEALHVKSALVILIKWCLGSTTSNLVINEACYTHCAVVFVANGHKLSLRIISMLHHKCNGGGGATLLVLHLNNFENCR